MLSYLNVSAVRSNFFLFGIKSAGIGTLNLLLQLSFQWVDPCFCLKKREKIHTLIFNYILFCDIE